MTNRAATYHSRITRNGRIESLPDLLGFVERASRAAGLDEDAVFEVRLAVEEVCANIILHGYRDGMVGPIVLDFQRGRDSIVLTVADEAPPFSPSDAPPPDLESDWKDRPIGGLGWFLTHSVMDEVRHEPGRDGGNRITLIKHFASRHEPPTP